MKRILFLGAHVDDNEISCGGTIARMVEEGHKVTLISMSHRYGTLDLKDEFKASCACLNVSYDYHNLETRYFSDNRQELLDELYKLKDDYDTVYCHDISDAHADHSTVGFEALRAFKNQSIFMYASPFNNLQMNENYFVKLEERHIEKKLQALACYTSQSHRRYMNPEIVRANAILRGLQCGAQYAEAFRAYKIIQ